MRPIFKTEMLIYQSKTTLDEKHLFGNITHHVDQEIKKIIVKGIISLSQILLDNSKMKQGMKHFQ